MGEGVNGANDDAFQSLFESPRGCVRGGGRVGWAHALIEGGTKNGGRPGHLIIATPSEPPLLPDCIIGTSVLLSWKAKCSVALILIACLPKPMNDEMNGWRELFHSEPE